MGFGLYPKLENLVLLDKWECKFHNQVFATENTCSHGYLNLRAVTENAYADLSCCVSHVVRDLSGKA